MHKPTGIVVTGAERRSQHENRAQALLRLRQSIAVQCRAPLPGEIAWPPTVQIRDGRLRVGESNAGVWHVLGLALDALATCGGRLSEAADRLGVSSSSLTRFLAEHPKAWVEANRIRAAAGLKPLK